MIVTILAATAAGFATLQAASWLRWSAQAAAILGGMVIGHEVDIDNSGSLILIVASICFISLAAGASAGRSTSGFWLITVKLALNLVLALACLAIVLTGGAIIFSAISGLLRMRRA